MEIWQSLEENATRIMIFLPHKQIILWGRKIITKHKYIIVNYVLRFGIICLRLGETFPLKTFYPEKQEQDFCNRILTK